MPRNAGAIAKPDAIVAANVVEDACQRLDAARATDDATMQADGHHTRLPVRAPAVQPVERVPAVDEEILRSGEVTAALQAAVIRIKGMRNHQMRPAGDPR